MRRLFSFGHSLSTVNSGKQSETSRRKGQVEADEKARWIFRWFKFTLKPPYTIASGNLLSAIWDTSHWTSFVKFGLKTA